MTPEEIFLENGRWWWHNPDTHENVDVTDQMFWWNVKKVTSGRTPSQTG